MPVRAFALSAAELDKKMGCVPSDVTPPLAFCRSGDATDLMLVVLHAPANQM